MLITEAAVDCSADFGKFPGKQPRWSPILVQLQALILLKQDLTMVVFVESFKNFQNYVKKNYMLLNL